MTEYMPRSAWTSSARGGARLTGASLQGLACHWPGSSTSAYGVESAGNVASRLRGWRTYHVAGRGWSDIGYNFAIDQAGRVWDLRGSGRVGAHAASASNPDANHEFVGVLFIVGADEAPTDAMTRAFWDFRRDVFLDKWPGRGDVRGHREVPGASTACPGDQIIRLSNAGPTDDDEDEMTPEDRAWIGDQLAGLRDLIERRTGDVVAHPYRDDDNPHYYLSNAVADIWQMMYDMPSSVWDHLEENPTSTRDPRTKTRMSQFVRSTWNATHGIPDHIDDEG